MVAADGSLPAQTVTRRRVLLYRNQVSLSQLDTSAEGNERKVDHDETSTYKARVGQAICRAMTTPHLPLQHKSGYDPVTAKIQ
ncbi:hypothetical protein TTRE_0000513901 [Trichuris trichiura]|uniref:Uncharacterized protein n=1 Tax=Trichuris trichiura TaxID=36087 RepID=A0A077Z9F5_TRITR|nr:hypothetical protein TTRE_0000513901 [Trichuris trichiura]